MKNKKPSNVHALPEMENKVMAAMENAKRNLPTIMEYASILAKMRKAHYDACIESGFTKDQALKLAAEFMK